MQEQGSEGSDIARRPSLMEQDRRDCAFELEDLTKDHNLARVRTSAC